MDRRNSKSGSPPPINRRATPKRDLDRAKLYRQIAREEGLLISEVKRIVEMQFEFAADVIRSGELDAVRLPHLGVFRVHPGRARHLERKGILPKKKPRKQP